MDANRSIFGFSKIIYNHPEHIPVQLPLNLFIEYTGWFISCIITWKASYHVIIMYQPIISLAKISILINSMPPMFYANPQVLSVIIFTCTWRSFLQNACNARKLIIIPNNLFDQLFLVASIYLQFYFHTLHPSLLWMHQLSQWYLDLLDQLFSVNCEYVSITILVNF